MSERRDARSLIERQREERKALREQQRGERSELAASLREWQRERRPIRAQVAESLKEWQRDESEEREERAQVASSLKERQREERERLILQAAWELFLERGFYETSIDDIAARVGIAKGTVYLHFPSKEELIFTIFERGRQEFLASLDEMLSSPAPPREKLRAVLEQVYNGMLGKHFQLLMSVFQNPEFRSYFTDEKHGGKHGEDSRWGTLSEGVGKVLEEGKASGDFDPSLPTPIMLSVFMGFLSPHNYISLFVRDHMAADEVVSYLSRCLFRAIAAPGSEGEKK